MFYLVSLNGDVAQWMITRLLIIPESVQHIDLELKVC